MEKSELPKEIENCYIVKFRPGVYLLITSEFSDFLYPQETLDFSKQLPDDAIIHFPYFAEDDVQETYFLE